jgi:hypothetical protein
VKRALKILLRVMAVAGWICISVALVRIFEPMESKAKRYFSDEDRVEAMISLFHKLEAANPSELGLIEMNRSKPGSVVFKTSKVPRSLVPQSFEDYQHGDDGPYKTPGSVLAHYDEAGKLAAVEFFESRMGCFIHRDPAVTLPPRPGSRIPIRTSPLWINARAHGD